MSKVLKLKPVMASQNPNPNVVVLSDTLKGQDDRNTYLALLGAVYYPVEFDNSVPAGRVDVSQRLLNHDKSSDIRVEVVSKSDLISNNKINKEFAGEIKLEIKKVIPALDELRKIDRQNLMEACKLTFARHPFCAGQSLIISCEGLTLELNVTSIAPVSADAPVFYLNDASKFNLSLSNPAPRNLSMPDIFNFDKAKFADYNQHIVGTLNDFRSAVTDLKQSSNIKKLNVLIRGDIGTGKTELAKNMAFQSGATDIHVITAHDVLMLPLNEKLKFITDEFKHAQQTRFSVVILDGLDDIIKSDVHQDQMRINIKKLLDDNGESPNKCVIIATTSNEEELEISKLAPMFNETYHLENVRIKNRNEAEILLLPFCEVMGYTLVRALCNTPVALLDCSIDIPIRELRVRIDRFCLHNKGELRVDQFLEESRGLNEKRKIASQTQLISTAGGSPLHQLAESTPARSCVRFVSK